MADRFHSPCQLVPDRYLAVRMTASCDGFRFWRSSFRDHDRHDQACPRPLLNLCPGAVTCSPIRQLGNTTGLEPAPVVLLEALGFPTHNRRRTHSIRSCETARCELDLLRGGRRRRARISDVVMLPEVVASAQAKRWPGPDWDAPDVSRSLLSRVPGQAEDE